MVALVGVMTLAAQAPGRLATSPQGLLASPVFFHGRQIAVRAQVTQDGALTRLQVPIDEAAVARNRTIPQVFVFWKESSSRSEGEIRGEFWDLGRISVEDGRFSGYDFRTLVDTVTNGRWPAREEIFVVLGATIQEAQPPRGATVRAIVMTPDEYASRDLTVSGRFRGRNLYGDLPGPLNRSKWDFVLQSADAAVWITGLRPRGKGFDLDPGARVDTGRWLEVSGVVHVEGPAVWIEARSMQIAAPPQETPVDVVVPVAPRQPPPAVVFSAPVPEEIDVELDTSVRIQFSRDMDPRSFENRVRVRYVPAGAQPPAEPPDLSFTYNAGIRALQIKLAAPLARFAVVAVDLLEGITATDGQPLEPWTLRFTTGS
jgi:hypothetical protein